MHKLLYLVIRGKKVIQQMHDEKAKNKKEKKRIHRNKEYRLGDNSTRRGHSILFHL